MGELVIYAPQKAAGQALCRLLERQKFQPRYLQSLEDLLDKLRFGYGGIIILDISSALEMNEELDNVLKLAEEIPIILVSPYGSDEQELTRFKGRGYHFIEKPISIPKLVELIRSLNL